MLIEPLPVEDPVQVFKALGGLEVIRGEKVVCKCNENPDKIGTEEEGLASQLVNPVARCCNLRLLTTNNITCVNLFFLAELAVL